MLLQPLRGQIRCGIVRADLPEKRIDNRFTARGRLGALPRTGVDCYPQHPALDAEFSRAGRAALAPGL